MVAFLISWEEEQDYAFPPFALPGQCLQKIAKRAVQSRAVGRLCKVGQLCVNEVDIKGMRA